MKKQIIIGVIVFVGTFIISFIITTIISHSCNSAGCMLDKQIKLENQIKKLKQELDTTTQTKDTLYNEEVNAGLSGFTQSNPVLDKTGAEITLTGIR